MQLEDIYKQAGVILPELVVKQFEDARIFHESVVSNRRLYLNSELEEARKRLADRAIESKKLDERRANIMMTLSSHGALEQFTFLQAEYGRLQGEKEVIAKSFEQASNLETLVTQQEINRKQLLLRLQRDFAEQNRQLDLAISTFESISSNLYEVAGNLRITPTENGPSFDIPIPGGKSMGINKMRIFCFDIMLMVISSINKTGTGFLVHDSHLFDGVDERQIASALETGAFFADKYNFQYIVTLNSDTLPQKFNTQKYIIPVKLTDSQIDGGLFGIRFD